MANNTMTHAMEKAGVIPASPPSRSFSSAMCDEMKRTSMSFRDIKEQSRVPIDILKSIAAGHKDPDPRTLNKLYLALPRLRHYGSLAETEEVLSKEKSEARTTKTQKTSKPVSEPDTIPFHNLLRAEMKREKISSSDLSKLLEMSESGVYAWVNGKTFPRRSAYEQILDLFPRLRQFPVPSGVRDIKGRPGRKTDKPEPVTMPPEPVTVPPEAILTHLDPTSKNSFTSSNKKAAFKLGYMVSQLQDRSTILEVLRTAQLSSISISELIELFDETN